LRFRSTGFTLLRPWRVDFQLDNLLGKIARRNSSMLFEGVSSGLLLFL
jgi:hypothetical protein